MENIVSDSETASSEVNGVEVRIKPSQFDPHWVQEIVAHLVECFFSLSSFLPLLDEAIEVAIELGFPKLWVFFNFYTKMCLIIMFLEYQ